MSGGNAGTNWAGSHAYTASAVRHPRDVDEVRRLVRAGSPVRALGSRHCFNDIADTTGELVCLDRFAADVEVDEATRTVSVPGGLRYGDLVAPLREGGWALPNLASLPHISVVGAVATGTHGSGVGNGSLATAVAALEMVDGRGELVRLDRSDHDFEGAVVSLGALGVVTRIWLDVVPAFDVRQDLYEGLRWADLLEHLDEIMASAYSVSVFTDWAGDEVGVVWLKSRLGDAEPPVEIHGAAPLQADRHIIPGMPVANITAQCGVPGPWFDRLPHFRLEFTPSAGAELQSELLLPRARAQEALESLRDLAEEVAPILHVTELRTVAADPLWLSGAYGHDVLGVHFTWKPVPDRVAPVLAEIEDRLLPLGARPHWGKLFHARREALEPLWPRFGDFADLARRHDPGGLFRNDYLRRTLGL